ncbi:hypothetical protein DUI87_17747 [Hirundo rustica rustica]|uniref:Uncharacterized protein n=1 Tax=Hirundo rustica rustica TaxID=333673 RepID=A0A3M0JX89_HIRRU|nr:hypothetical protein DUI87_17747 [Hirundo rustica rustica]
MGKLNRPGILEIITNWPEGENFGLTDEEQEQVTRAEEAPPYNQLPAEETHYALFTDGSCRIVGMNRKWKAAVWSPTRQVAEATEGEGGSSELAELKAVQLALDIAEREGWPRLYLYTDSWMVANALWGWLRRVERLPVKVRHVDAHIPKSRANEEHRNNEQVDRAAKIEVSKIDLDWEHKGELFLARWAHDASGHQGRDATYKWARDRGVDLTMDSISQVIHDCEMCAAIKQAKRVKPLWYGGRWSKYKYGEAWQIDYITLPQTRQGKRYVLTMVEATTGWLETYPVPHATARNTILGLEKQVLWRHGTPERIESDNGTHFKNSLIKTWAREHGIEWVYHIPYHAPAAGKVERHNALLKTQLKALGGGSFKNWEQHLAKATWLVNTRGSTNRAGPAQAEPLHTIDGDKVPVVHARGLLGKTVWIKSASSSDKPIRGVVFAQGPGCTWWIMQKDGTTRCVPQGDLIVGLLYTVCSFSRIWAEISRGADETPDPGRGNPEWCGEWEDMGQLLKEFSDPVVWDFPREQIQNPVELGKYLKVRYHDGSKGERIAAVSWALAYAYCTLLDTVGQQTEAGGKGYKSTATPVTQAATNTPVMKPAAKLEPEPESAAKPDSKPKPLAVALAKKHTLKTD